MASTQFLDLTNALLRRLNEVPIAQSDFASVRGVQAMAKDAINASIEQILQYEIYWPFNTSSTTQVLTAGTEEYAWPTNLKIPNWRSFAIDKDAVLNVRGHPLLFVSRDYWLKNLKTDDAYSGATGLSIPYYVFEKHGTGFGVTPSPERAYTVSYDYWLNNTALSLYSDTSTIPTNYDETILQGALYHFYMFRDNSQQAGIAEQRFYKNLQHMRTILINKENRVRGSMVARGGGSRYYMAQYAENLYPLA
jgi:hypothetical protein